VLAIAVGEFWIGATSSFAASLGILALTHLDELRYLFSSSGRYKYLSGTWHQYHLTCDTRHSPVVFWAVHTEEINVTRFGRVRGSSVGKYGLKLEYKIGGAIRQHVMRLRYTNQDAHELPTTVAYPHLLSSDVIAGIWVGHDYDERLASGPIILSRTELSADDLAAIVRNERLLTIAVRGRRPPVVDPAPAALEIPTSLTPIILERLSTGPIEPDQATTMVHLNHESRP
jgi:hypothetical protein